MEAFLAFAGDRPIVAHNADFDTGFMAAACRRSGLKFTPVYLDTLALAQALLPELKRFKLDIVSNHLELPKFNHHRASDDAMTERPRGEKRNAPAVSLSSSSKTARPLARSAMSMVNPGVLGSSGGFMMSRNARPATAYFSLPPGRVVELGVQVEL